MPIQYIDGRTLYLDVIVKTPCFRTVYGNPIP